VIVAVIAAFSAYKVGTIRAAGEDVGLEVKVTASQFYWQYEYANGVVAIDTLRLPVDEVVRLELRARTSDVVHSWWVPALGGKVDVIPGVVNELKFEPARIGTFAGKCAELCGLQHAAMLTSVEVVPREEFDQWLEEEGRAQSAGDSKLGEEMWTLVCSKCHFSAPEYAPNIAGSPLLGDAESIAEIVRNGRGRMPAVGEFWSDRQVAALTDYLETIAPGEPSGG
jgi:cytochrome c oxidase subunit 2